MKHVVKRSAAVNPLLVQKAYELVTVEANHIQLFMLILQKCIQGMCL